MSTSFSLPAVGLALVATLFVARLPSSSSARNPGQFTITVRGVPTVQQLVRIEEGAPYQVPPGKVLVMTGVVGGDPQNFGLSCTPTSSFGYASGFPWNILVDGRIALAGYVGRASTGSYPWSYEIPGGYAVSAGSLVEIDDPQDPPCTSSGSTSTWHSILLGYLQSL